MDKLIFTNALGQSLEFSSASKYKWVKVDDLGGLDTDIQTSTSPYQDGSTVVGGAYFKTKAIKMDIAVVSSNLLNDIRSMNSILNPKLGVGSLTYEKDGSSYTLQKVMARSLPSMPDGKSRGASFQLSSILFEAYDPLYSDSEDTEEQVTASALLLEFPVDIIADFEFDLVFADGVPIYNTGDVDCPVTLIVDGAISSPLEIENTSTGEKVVIALDLLDNERLTITTELDNINVIKKDLITGVETVAFEYMDVAETTFFYLQKGENKIKVTANEGDVESAYIRYRNKYVGV